MINSVRNRIFYFLRPIIPRKVQILLRRRLAQKLLKRNRAIWPIDSTAGKKPEGWRGWPDGKQFALVLAHDVDTLRGIRRVEALAALEQELGFVSTFNIVPERYDIPTGLIERVHKMGFGIGVHGLKHDGKLFNSLKIFEKRAVRINDYLRQWKTRGFSAPSMHHNLSWMHLLDIDYSTATFDTDPFEPQPDGAGTIFPYTVKNKKTGRSFLEMPYTMAQDFTLFIILEQKNDSFWMEKLDWIARVGGMALINTHSDYMAFNAGKSIEEYPVKRYLDFLCHIKEKYKGKFWHARTTDVADYCIDMYRNQKKHSITSDTSIDAHAYKRHLK